jgi:thiol-disulfide isomerase/thioredoxin
MAETPSTMLELGTTLPYFRLPDVEGGMVADTDHEDAAALLVAFICPHCPYVKHIREEFVKFASEYRPRGLAIVAINSNDAKAFPDDDIVAMRKEAAGAGYTFPYLCDDTQEVAKTFRAACTPDFFLFDRHRRLVYRGQFDSSRPKMPGMVTGTDLRAAADAVLAGRSVPATQYPSIGCNIKWKPGNAPDYFGAEADTARV